MKKQISLRPDLMPLGSRTARLTFLIFALVDLNNPGWECEAEGNFMEDARLH